VRRSAGSAPSLRHLPFFERLASVEEQSPEGRHATAGLLILRLIDHWELAGPQIVAPESVSVRAVRAAIMALPTGDAIRECLLGIVNTMQTLREMDVQPVLPRLFAYAQLLERRAEHALAEDVYVTIASRAVEEFETDLLVDAHLRTGFCRRTLGRFREAEEAYQRAGVVAKRHGEPQRALRSRVGLAIVASQVGNLPKSHDMFVGIIDDAKESGFPALAAECMHTLATVIYKQGFPVRALRMATESLRHLDDAIEMERVLGTIGALLIALERYTTARDTLLVVEATAVSEEMRRTARHALMTVAARAGDREEFDRTFRLADAQPVGAENQANFFIESARGFRRFGELARAAEQLSLGRLFAETHGLNRSVFEIESMEAELERERAAAAAEAEADATVATGLPEIEREIYQFASARGR